MLSRFEVMNRKIVDFFGDNLSKIREINKRYSEPRIKMTKMVHFSLLFLRLYLVLLIGLVVYKFVMMIIG